MIHLPVTHERNKTEETGLSINDIFVGPPLPRMEEDDGSNNPPNHILFLTNLPPETQEGMLNMLFNR